MSTITSMSRSKRPRHSSNSVDVQQLRRRAAAVADDHALVLVAVREQVVDRRAQRRQTEAAGHDHHIAGDRLGQRPRAAERPAQTDQVARSRARTALSLTDPDRAHRAAQRVQRWSTRR